MILAIGVGMLKRLSPRITGTWAWTADAQIWVPDTQYGSIPEGHRAEALRGSAHTMAVLSDAGLCVGWIRTENAK